MFKINVTPLWSPSSPLPTSLWKHHDCTRKIKNSFNSIICICISCTRNKNKKHFKFCAWQLYLNILFTLRWQCIKMDMYSISLGFCMSLWWQRHSSPLPVWLSSERNHLFTYECAVETCQVKVGGKGNVHWYFHYPPGSAHLQIIPCVRTEVSAMCVSLRGA